MWTREQLNAYHRVFYNTPEQKIKRHLAYKKRLQESKSTLKGRLKLKETTKKSHDKYRSNPENRKKEKLNERNWSLKHKFGITQEEYNKKFIDQKGKCAICHRPQSEFKKGFAVDHDHLTRKIRGLLCTRCNPALGAFQDDINILKNAIKYLENHGT